VTIPVETLSVFVAASGALAIAPGPDNIFVLTQSALHGRTAGLCVTLGLCTGLLVHTMAVAVGVAAILAASAVAFTILKIAGAAYLAYLAWRAFRAGAAALSAHARPVRTTRKLYLRGVIMNVTNPKVAIFFLAFLPQFADASRGSVTTQIVLLGAAFMAVTLVVFGSIAWFSGYVGERLAASPCAQMWLNRTAGVVFLALSVRLLAAQR
jgi:threonine/homoserine/homoserine lactone efflux protein